MSESLPEPQPMSLEQAAQSVGMPEAIPDDVRTPEGRAAFEADLDAKEAAVDSVDADLGKVSERAEQHNQLATGRRPLNTRARVAAGLALSAATLVSPPGQEAVKSVASAAVEVAQDFSKNLDNDRVFNPDAGNPANTAEIVSSWNEDPSKTVVTVDANYGDAGIEAEQADTVTDNAELPNPEGEAQ